MKQIAMVFWVCFSFTAQAMQVHVVAEKDEQDFEVSPAILASSSVCQNIIELSKGAALVLDLRTVITQVQLFEKWLALYNSPQYLFDLKNTSIEELSQLVALSHFLNIAEFASDALSRLHPLHPRQLLSWAYHAWLKPEERALFPYDVIPLYVEGYFVHNTSRLSEAMQRWAGQLSVPSESMEQQVETICALLDNIEGFLWLHVHAENGRQAWLVRRPGSHQVDMWYLQPNGRLARRFAFSTEITPVIASNGNLILNEGVESVYTRRVYYHLAAYRWETEEGSGMPLLRRMWRKQSIRLDPLYVTDDGKFIVGYWEDTSKLYVLSASSGEVVQFRSVKHLTQLEAPWMAPTGAWQTTFTYIHENVRLYTVYRSSRVDTMTWDPAGLTQYKSDERADGCAIM